jgi:ketosteroid isomerase-like protein
MNRRPAEDVVELGRLQARYADVVSRRAWDEMGELFRPDTVVRLDTVSAPARTITGPSAFTEFVAGAIERYDYFVFVVLNSVVDVDGDEADGRMFMCEIRHDRSSDTWQNAHGMYHDHYVHLEGRWWFAERRYRSLARTGPGGAVFGLPSGIEPIGGPLHDP